MRLTDKTERYSMGARNFEGRYKKWKCNMCYSPKSIIDEGSYWYFYCSKDEQDKRYNSLWSKLKYTSKEECHDACVKYIDEREKNND